jgi:hypothetical protein
VSFSLVKLRIVALGGTLPNPPEQVNWGDLRNSLLFMSSSYLVIN